MKQVAKILIIISMVIGICAIFPTVLGAIALKKMKEGSLSTGWKIVVLLLVNTIAGILLLVDKDA
ncbi:MAG: hypothetical protein IJZ42_13035 [Lachnospiraceae bacterium]|nr:hypothetical protein [Lachnospiraceae bacterium]